MPVGHLAVVLVFFMMTTDPMCPVNAVFLTFIALYLLRVLHWVLLALAHFAFEFLVL